MKVLVEEYGKLLLYIIIGSALIVAIVTGIGSWYNASFSFFGKTSLNESKVEHEIPVLLVEPIEIKQQEVAKEIDFRKYALAYENNSCTDRIIPEVYGVDGVDLTKQGLYEVVFKVRNKDNESFTKKVPVLVY